MPLFFFREEDVLQKLAFCMTIHALTRSRVAEVATLMSTLKPEWWDFEGANQRNRPRKQRP